MSLGGKFCDHHQWRPSDERVQGVSLASSASSSDLNFESDADWMSDGEIFLDSGRQESNSAWQKKCPRLSADTLIREFASDQLVEVTVGKRWRPKKGKSARKLDRQGPLLSWGVPLGESASDRLVEVTVGRRRCSQKSKGGRKPNARGVRWDKRRGNACRDGRHFDGIGPVFADLPSPNAAVGWQYSLIEQYRDEDWYAFEMLSGGFTAKQLLVGGYSAKELLYRPCPCCYGCPATYCLDSGVSVERFRIEGCLAREMRYAGFKAQQMCDGGYSAGQMRGGGFTAREMRHCGYSARQMLDDGYTAAELRDGGFTLRRMRDEGLTVHELRSAGFNDAALTAAGFRVLTLRIGFCQPTGQVKVSCYDQDGCEIASACANPADTLLQFTKELEGRLGESVIFMIPSGFVLGLDEDAQNLDEILDMSTQCGQEFSGDDFL